MAEAQGPSQNAAPQHDQTYMAYPSQGSTYGSPPSTGPGGVFNSVYGSNYGY